MDIVFDNDGDLMQDSDGDIIFGETDMQDVATLLQLNPADLKYDPVIGPGLIRFVKGVNSQQEIEKEIAQQLKLDGKDFNTIKKLIKTT